MKVQKQIWALRNLVKLVTLPTAIIFFHACIMSHIRYGIALWGKSAYAETSFVLQKKAIRDLLNKPPKTRCREFFIKHKIFTIPSLYIYECITFAIKNSLINPADMLPQHRYLCRHDHIQNGKISLVKSESNIKYSAIQLFNVLPSSIKEHFRKGEYNHFFHFLECFLINNAFYEIKDFIEKRF